MSSRFPIWPPQRLPRPVLADWSITTGTVSAVEGVGGITLYTNVTSATWMGRGKLIGSPSTIVWLAGRMTGSAGDGNNTAEWGIYLLGANKTMIYSTGDNVSQPYRWMRYAGTTWPPGAFESTIATNTPGVYYLGPYVGIWFDRTVSPARARCFVANDLTQNPDPTQAPLGAFVFDRGVSDPALSGGGANDIGAPVQWGLAFWQDSATWTRMTMTEASEGDFLSTGYPNNDISGNTNQGTQLVGRGPYTVGRGHQLGGSPSSWWD